MIDAVTTVHTLLTDNYTKANTGGHDAHIIFDDEAVYINEHQEDKILVSETSPAQTKEVGKMQQKEDQIEFVTVRVSTPLTKVQVKLMVDEVNRIRKLKSSDPDSDFHTWTLRRRKKSHSHSAQGGSVYRYILEFRLTRLDLDIS